MAAYLSLQLRAGVTSSISGDMQKRNAPYDTNAIVICYLMSPVTPQLHLLAHRGKDKEGPMTIPLQIPKDWPTSACTTPNTDIKQKQPHVSV